MVRWPFRDSRRSPVPQQPQLHLKCKFIPALTRTGGFLLAPLSLHQARPGERALPCSPALTRSYLGPAGCTGSGGTAVWAPLGEWSSGPCRALRAVCPSQARVGDTGRHRPMEAAAREVRGCPMLRVPGPPVWGRGGSYYKPKRGRALGETTRFLPSNGPPTVLTRIAMSSFHSDRPMGSCLAARPVFRCLPGRAGPS